MLTNTIYVYYADYGNPQEPPLIELWKERWLQEGWTPVVLGLEDAKKDLRYAAMLEHIRHWPTLPNMKDFNHGNMVRWLAFSQFDGAVTDYDVFPLKPFPPRDFGGFVCSDGCGGPGFIVGTKADFARIADVILNYEKEPDDRHEGKEHVCDMRILHKRARPLYDKILYNIECYGRHDWLTKDLVHFGNAYMKPYHVMSRVDQVRRILDVVRP